MHFNLTELSTERFNRVTALLEYLDPAVVGFRNIIRLFFIQLLLNHLRLFYFD